MFQVTQKMKFIKAEMKKLNIDGFGNIQCSDLVMWIHFFYFWSIIHSSVLKKIEKVCRDFIWLGAYYSTNPGNVSWSNVCSLKVAGGRVYKAD